MTNENKPAETAPSPPLKWERSLHGVFETYANQGHITWSLDDVNLLFAQVGEAEESLGPGAKIVPINVLKATITISWRNAKILHRLLGQVLANYERVNGEINLAPTLASSEGT